MRLPQVRFTVSRMMTLVAVLAGLMAMVSGSHTTYFSCHLCHNRKTVYSRAVGVLTFARYETQPTDFPTSPGHRHVWRPYANATDSLLGGGSGASSRVYVDGSVAPDGLH